MEKHGRINIFVNVLLSGILNLITAFAGMLPSIIQHGGYFVSKADYITQQIPFILETKRMFSTGMPYWSWNSFLGDNFLGGYAFYTVGSPFVWIATLFPENHILQGITVSILLKFFVCGITSFLYFRIFIKKPIYAIIGSLLYTFSSFTILNTQFNHFTDVIALFPLIPTALELRLYKKKRIPGLLTFAVFINLLTNYYFFVSSGIFIVIYALFRFKSGDWAGNKRNDYSAILIEGILGILLTAFLILPAWYKISEAPRVDRIWKFKTGIFNILERLRALFMPAGSLEIPAFYPQILNWSSIGAFLPITGAILAVSFIRQHPRNWLSQLLICLVIISLIAPLNASFNLWSNYSYTRWWYALSLILALSTINILSHPDKLYNPISHKYFLYILTFLILITVPFISGQFICEKGWFGEMFSSRWTNWFGRYTDTNKLISGYSTILTIINYLLLFVIINYRISSKNLLFITCLASAINMGSFIEINNRIDGVNNSDQSLTVFLTDSIHNISPQYEYRIDFDPANHMNMGLYQNEPAISVFHSLQSRSHADFISISGYIENIKSPTNEPSLENREYTDALLSVRYFYRYVPFNTKYIPEGFRLKKKNNKSEIYENQNFIPFGFTYDRAINRTEFDSIHQTDPQKNRCNILLSSIVLEKQDWEKYRSLFQYTKIDTSMDVAQLSRKRNEVVCSSFHGNSTGFTAEINLPKENLIFFSVPYDSGFSATVNGEKREIIKTNISFMAVKGDKGKNTINFTYVPPGIKDGILISTLALIFFIIYIGKQILYSSKKRRLSTLASRERR